jgi:hypothetical protein
LFFSRAETNVDCLTEDLAASKENGIRMYHHMRKG